VRPGFGAGTCSACDLPRAFSFRSAEYCFVRLFGSKAARELGSNPRYFTKTILRQAAHRRRLFTLDRLELHQPHNRRADARTNITQIQRVLTDIDPKPFSSVARRKSLRPFSERTVMPEGLTEFVGFP
jgi:hypothetical protein